MLRFSLRTTLSVVASTLLMGGIVSSRVYAQTVDLARWNFNDVTASAVANAAARTALSNSDAGVYSSTIATNFAFTNGTQGTVTGINHASGTTINAFAGDVAGEAVILLADDDGTAPLLENNGSNISFAVSTVGYNNVAVSFANVRNATGFDAVRFAYSINGTTFTNLGAAYDPTTTLNTQTFDLSGIAGLQNNPDATFRLTFNGATASSGFVGIDNLRVTGVAIVPEAGTVSLLGVGATLLGGILIRWKRAVKN